MTCKSCAERRKMLGASVQRHGVVKGVVLSVAPLTKHLAEQLHDAADKRARDNAKKRK